MREKLRKSINLALDLTMRSIAWKDENDAYFYGRILARYGLMWIDLNPDIYNYPESYRPVIVERKMLAANDRG